MAEATAPPPAAAEAASAAAALAAMRVKIITVVVAYFFVSISLVFLNKVMLTEGTSIPAPLAVTWFQCVVTSAILYALGLLGRGAAPGSFFEQFPEARYDPAVATRSTVALLGLVFVGMITFNNLALKYVEVSFYNVARSLTIVFNVLLTFALLGERTSLPVLGTLAVVVAGFFLGSAGEVRFSWTGCLFGITSSLFVALNGIYNKKALAEKELSNNIWRLSLYNNVSASLLFVPLIFLSGEHTVILANWHVLAQPQFWAFQLAGGVFGFLIGIVTTLQIKVTGPLTHNISGTAKAGVQTLLALLIWKNPTTAMNLAGTGLVLLGSMGYTHVSLGAPPCAPHRCPISRLSPPPPLNRRPGRCGTRSWRPPTRPSSRRPSPQRLRRRRRRQWRARARQRARRWWARTQGGRCRSAAARPSCRAGGSSARVYFSTYCLASSSQTCRGEKGGLVSVVRARTVQYLYQRCKAR
jgi:GDP-fucose transporter C1